jgi:hypothetical protein
MSKGKSTQTTTTTTDPTQMAIYSDLYNKSKSIAAQPFIPYTGSRVAGFNPDQLQGFDATRNMFNQSMGFDPRQGLNNLANQATPTVTPFTGTSTQLQPAALQQASNISPVERFGGATLGQAQTFGGANIKDVPLFGGANIAPVEKFGGANISPVDLYSGATVNRGDVRDLTPTSLLDTNLGAYQNPFQSQVIDNTLSDLNRARQIQIQSDQDAAIGSGAFGGSRSAILEAETNRNFADRAGNIAANLRSQGFDKATSLAGQDINRDFQAQQMMSDADKAIAMQNASFGQQAGLAKQGLLGDVSLNQARLNQQAGLAGMDASNARSMQQGQLDQQAGLARQGLLGDIAQNQARLDTQTGLANTDAINRNILQQGQFQQQAGMAGMDAFNRAATQQAQLDANRFGADQSALNRFGLQQGQFDNQMNMANMDAMNRAAFMQPGLEMQNRQFQAGLLGNQLSDQYRNLGMLSGIGSQQQGLQQAGLDAGYNEFLRAINYGPQQLGLLAQGVSAIPQQNTTSQTGGYRPGTFEQIGNAAGTIGTIMGLFSDEKLKDNITLVGQSKGHNVYTWTWNNVAKELGINTPEIGVIAQEVAHIPNAVFKHESGYLTVNYGAL